MFNMNKIFVLLFNLQILVSNAQQNYSSNLGCNPSGISPASLYTCNGLENSCQAFLVTYSQKLFNSVPTIAALMAVNPSTLAKINNVTTFAVFPDNKQVIVPVGCFCSGKYYLANTTFHVTDEYGTYYIIASDVYRGLTTCDALRNANSYNEYKLVSGLELQIPLRCACPTTNQTESGARYLVTYSLNSNDSILDISNRFNVSEESILDANGLVKDSSLHQKTTILIPLPNRPSSSQMIIPLNNSEISQTRPGESSSKRKFLTGGVASGCSLFIFGVFLFAAFLSYRKKNKEFSTGPNEKTRKQVLPEDLRVEIASLEQDLKVFEFHEIRKTTNDFSSTNKINGSVYRADFEEEILIIKRMSADVTVELNILKRINHFNLIKLQGVCENEGCCYLIFEYMIKGSLNEWLKNENTGSWTNRIRIALDVASGLHYLHSFARPAYVHMNINSSNILLNSNLRAKIANFTLARPSENESISTSAQFMRVVGTRGYMSPEYREEIGFVTPKIDVYAFGVILLELISGKDAVVILDGNEVLLSEIIVSLIGGENAAWEIEGFIHHPLKGTEFAMRIAKLSTACLNHEPERRPGMEEVVSTLLKIQADVQKSEFH
ncbi:hypothetical protein ACFE04_005350 [Oxalis oulophora]